MPVFGTSVDDGAEVDFTSSEARGTGRAGSRSRAGPRGSACCRMSWPRATRANALGALLALLLGAGIAAQVQLTNQRGLDELSQTDLVRVLDDISLRSSRLDQQVRELESTRDRLKNGTGTAAEALEQAQKRADTLGILAGTVAAKGPGHHDAHQRPDQCRDGTDRPRHHPGAARRGRGVHRRRRRPRGRLVVRGGTATGRSRSTA